MDFDGKWVIAIIGTVIAAVIAVTLLPTASGTEARLDALQATSNAILVDTTAIEVDTTAIDGKVDDVQISRQDDVGPQSFGGAIMATLRVNPNGDGTDGLTWATAFQNIPEALDAASVDPEDVTLIMIALHPTFYDINLTGDPTWAANVVLWGTEPDFAIIRNNHATATSILKLTGKSAIVRLEFYLGVGSVNGVIMTSSGSVVQSCIFEGTGLTGAATALHLDGADIHHNMVLDTDFHGNVAFMTGLLIDQAGFGTYRDLHFTHTLRAVHIVGANSDDNDFLDVDIGLSALGIDIDAGNEQHFKEIRFHGNTRNVDDEVGDHDWDNLIGAIDIAVLPNDFAGVTITTGAAGVYGADTELLSAVSRDNPFRIVGYAFDPNAAPVEWYQIRFSDDGGATFFDTIQFQDKKNQGSAAPSGTEHIFNAGTRISASARTASGGDNVVVWVRIQEL